MFMWRSRIAMILAGLLAAIGLLVACSGPDAQSGISRKSTREFDRVLATLAQAELVHDPELASRLGLTEETAGFAFSGRLTDRSQAAFERQRLSRLETIDNLMRAPLPAEKTPARRHLDVLISVYGRAERLASAGHGTIRIGQAFPYVADHLHGAYIDVPDLLTRSHRITNRKEAENYVRRLAGLTDALDDERRRLIADARAGVAPPLFVVDRMIAMIGVFAAGPAETHMLVQSLDTAMAGAASLSETDRSALRRMAIEIVQRDVLPAYGRYMSDLQSLRPLAIGEPGVWQLPDGDAFYSEILAGYAGQARTAEALHAFGHDEVERLSAELDTALIAAGYAEGSVGQRLSALTRQQGQIYPATLEGEAALLNRLNQHASAAQAALAGQVARQVKTQVSIAAVPDYLEAASMLAAYTPAPARSPPSGLFEINLARMDDWPDYSLATLVFHEVVPGHHFESAFAAEHARLPLARRIVWDNGYGEGWATYAETLADESGLYENDPLGRIGYLQSMLFRAARLVADTGMHRMRWSRDQTVSYLVSVTGQPEAQMLEEVDRYAVWPGQAAAYWTGRSRIIEMREKAKRSLGTKFSPIAFHEVILAGGPRPLDFVEADIDLWISEAQTK